MEGSLLAFTPGPLPGVSSILSVGEGPELLRAQPREAREERHQRPWGAPHPPSREEVELDGCSQGQLHSDTLTLFLKNQV